MKNEQMRERTEENLMNALIDLCMERPYLDLSITDICERADVSRSTFYRLYANKDALQKRIGRKYMEEVRAISEPFLRIAYTDYLKDHHVYDNELRKIWEYHLSKSECTRVLLSSNGDPYFTHLMYSFLEEAYQSVLWWNNISFGSNQDIIIRFQVNGIIAVLYNLAQSEDTVLDQAIETLTKLFVNIPMDNYVVSR